MPKIPKRNVARVWCGAIPRRGSGQNAGTHMMFCQDCRRVRKLYWRVVEEQSNA